MVHFSFYLEGIPCQNDCGNNQRESGQDSQDRVDHQSRKNKELLVSGTNTAQAGRDQVRRRDGRESQDFCAGGVGPAPRPPPLPGSETRVTLETEEPRTRVPLQRDRDLLHQRDGDGWRDGRIDG